MQPTHSLHPSRTQAADLVRALARQLHHAAISDSLRESLPVLRRILATHTLRDLSLPQLFQQRVIIQRKHLLRTLAIEAGYPSWEHYSRALPGMTASQLPHLDMLQANAVTPTCGSPARHKRRPTPKRMEGVSYPWAHRPWC